MSGIAGILNLDGRPADTELIGKMTAAIEHRGPDEEGQWVNGPIGLGHRMLRTTPESLHEHQPIVLDNGNYVIACDGRVDNREELMGLLKEAPVGIDTPDAELILRAYMAWDTECLGRLVGDFAFAIWDGRRRQLFCARDPMGIRLFHYYYDGRRFVFGTEIKELFVDSDVPRRLNEAKIGLHLALSGGDAEQTFYERIYRLPGGYSMLVTPDGIRKRVYWEPDPADQIELASDEEYAERFSELFRQAVRARLRSTGPVGVQLSGGLDSTSVLCTAEVLRRESGDSLPQLQFFSAVFPGLKSVDESKYIQQIVDKYGTPGEQMVADDMWGLKWDEEPQAPRDEPYIIAYEAWARALLHRGREAGVRIWLTGMGGDEGVSAGTGYLVDLLRGLGLRRLRRQLRHVIRPSKAELLRETFRTLVPWRAKRLWARSRNSGIPTWVDRQFARRIGLHSLMDKAEPPARYQSLYIQELYDTFNSRGRLMPSIWAETTPAEFGIELRHPFYDLRLVDFLIRTPWHRKDRSGQTKRPLRLAMKGILPEGVRTRVGKTSFTPLFDRGFGEREVERLERTLKEPLVGRLGYVDAERLRKAFRHDSLVAGSVNDVTRGAFWFTFALEEWLQEKFAGTGGRGQAEMRISAPLSVSPTWHWGKEVNG